MQSLELGRLFRVVCGPWARLRRALPPNEATIILVLAGALVVRLWIMSLPAGYTLDESGLLWSISGGWSGLWQRTTVFPQSFLFAAMTLLWNSATGGSEWMLRIPSLLASLASLAFLHRLALRFGDSRAAAYAVLFLVCLPGWTEQASLLRPYAFGTLSVLISQAAFLRWIEHPRFADAVLFGLAAVLPGAFSVFLGLTVISHAVAASWLWSTGRCQRPALPIAAFPFVVTGIVSIPVLAHALSFEGNHVYTPSPSAMDLFVRLAPPALIVTLALTCGITFLSGISISEPVGKQDPVRGPATLYFIWALVPILVLFIVSRLTPLHVFLARYHVGASPMLALGWGVLFRRVGRATSRILSVIVLVAISLRGYVQLKHIIVQKSDIDWRSAAEFARGVSVRSGLRVLATGAFYEAQREYPVPASQAAIFLAPYCAYGLEATIVPAQLWGSSKKYLTSLSNELERASQPFLLIRHRYWDSAETSNALAHRFQRRVVFTANGISVERFEAPLTNRVCQ